MSDTTARLGLPMLQPGQAQKDMVHNEALALIDAAVHSHAESRGENAPPTDPAIGACWIVGSAPTGAWQDKADQLACWTVGGWRFVVPIEGMRIWCRDNAFDCVWTGSQWVDGVIHAATLEIDGKTVVRTQQSAIGDVSGGATIDSEARAAIAEILAVLRAHGLIAT